MSGSEAAGLGEVVWRGPGNARPTWGGSCTANRSRSRDPGNSVELLPRLRDVAPHAPGAGADPPLWASAVEVARAYGVHATARRLHLDYYALKQHVEAASGAGAAAARPVPPAFVEVLAPGLGPAAVSECVIDLADARRTTLRIALKSPALPDLAALSQLFWRVRACQDGIVHGLRRSRALAALYAGSRRTPPT